jgi:hypothetical protein
MVMTLQFNNESINSSVTASFLQKLSKLLVKLSVTFARITEFPKQLDTTNPYGQTNPRLLRPSRQ